MSFYVFLPSNDKSCSDNAANEFRVRLQEPLNLGAGLEGGSSYEVALVELSCRGVRSSNSSGGDGRHLVHYRADLRTDLGTGGKVFRRVWAHEDLQAYILWDGGGVVDSALEPRSFRWLLRNAGSRTIRLEIPYSFLRTYSFNTWQVLRSTAEDFARGAESVENLPPVEGNRGSRMAAEIALKALGGVDASDFAFHVVLNSNEVLEFVGSSINVIRKFALSTDLSQLYHVWQFTRVWRFSKEYVNAESQDLFTEQNLYMYCYTDIIEYQAVGSRSVPLLRVIELRQRDGGELKREDSALTNPYYLKVNRQHISEISIRLADQRGAAIGFVPGGQTVAVLHFRPRSSD